MKVVVTQAGVSIVVRVGSFADFDDMAGTSHALEHLCFMGSKEFPDENMWSAWLAANGGSSNAYTAREDTNYHYEVKASALEASLERFSRFFVSPLLSESSWSRELLNIDSEHAKNLTSDFWRMMQLDHTTACPTHPYSKFATGSSRTLRDEPEAAGIDTRARLLEHHRRHYTASRMRVAVVGHEDCATLMAWAHKYLSDVRDDGEPLPVYGSNPYEGCTGQLFRVVPLRESRSVTVQWVLPPSSGDDDGRQTSNLISHVIGHEGEGSLLSFLKRRGWATELMSGATETCDTFSVFSVRVELTPEGLAAVQDVLDAIFALVRAMRRGGPQQWVFEEVAAVSAARFRFRTKDVPISFAINLANNLCHHSARTAVSGPALLRTWDPEAFAAQLDMLRAANARIFISAQEVEDRCDRKEPVYGTDFSVEAIAPERIAGWDSDETPVPEGIGYPKPNRFIASDFELRMIGTPGVQRQTTLRNSCSCGKPADDHRHASSESKTDDEEREAAIVDGGAAAAPVSDEWRTFAEPDPVVREIVGPAVAMIARRRLIEPRVLEHGPWGVALFHQDTWYGEPRVLLAVDVLMAGAAHTPRDAALAELAMDCIQEELNELSYEASLASLRFSLGRSTRGASISVSGFSHKAAVLLAAVCDRLRLAREGTAAEPAIRDATVALRLDATLRRLRNRRMLQPYQIAMGDRAVIAIDSAHHPDDRLAALELIAAAGVASAADQVRRAAATALARTQMRMLVHGNASETEAQAAVAAVRAALGFESSSVQGLTPRELAASDLAPRPSIVPEGLNVRLVIPGRNPSDDNAAILLVLTLGRTSPRVRVTSTVLAHLLREPAFNQLRTIEGLGYIVAVVDLTSEGISSIGVLVQSNKMPAQGLEERVEAFLASFTTTLRTMEESAFQEQVHAALLGEVEEAMSLAAESRSVFDCISSGMMNFTDRRAIMDEAKTLTRDEIASIYEAKCAPSGPRRQRLAILVEHLKAQPLIVATPVAADDSSASDAAVEATAEAPSLLPAPAIHVLTGARAIEAVLAAADGAPPKAPAPDAIVVADLSGAELRACLPRAPAASFAAFQSWLHLATLA